MVSGSKLKCPSKVSWESLTFSLLQCNLWQLFGKCTGRDEKCGKCGKYVDKCEKCAGHSFCIYYSYDSLMLKKSRINTLIVVCLFPHMNSNS